ncbi:hypothetical protein ACPW6H_005567 [Pseudomonas aeruginosa]
MSIDWNTAPEGANKAGFTGHDQYLQFYRIPGMFGDYDYWSEKRGWSGNDFPTCANHLFDRPEKVEWDGQGLPPVGVRVSVFDDGDLVYGHGESGEVIAHVEDCAVIRMSYGLGCFTAKNLRTPEQIAAVEREKAIEEMCFAEETLTVKQAKALYDAGYRRQESST